MGFIAGGFPFASAASTRALPSFSFSCVGPPASPRYVSHSSILRSRPSVSKSFRFSTTASFQWFSCAVSNNHSSVCSLLSKSASVFSSSVGTNSNDLAWKLTSIRGCRRPGPHLHSQCLACLVCPSRASIHAKQQNFGMVGGSATFFTAIRPQPE